MCLLITVIIIIAVVFAAIKGSKRREGLLELARRLNLNFNPAKDYSIGERFSFLKQFHEGENRYATNVISGTYRQYNVLAFDFHYETHHHDKHGFHKHDHWFSFLILTVQPVFPYLTIRREGLFTKIAEAFGYEAIQFESAEFSRTFCVRSPDKKFAYDVCNAKMIEYLLANRDLSIEIENQAIALAFNARLSVQGFELNLQRLVEIRSRLPDFLFLQNSISGPPVIQQDDKLVRTLAMQTLSQQLGFSEFNPAHDDNFIGTWSFLSQFSQGNNRYVFNVLKGTYEEQPLYILDYHYETGSGKNVQHHFGTMLMLVVEPSFPQINIVPENTISRIEAVLDSKDVKFESDDFSRAFRVHAPDKKFAYDVCNPEMIEFLLGNRDLEIEIISHAILLAFTPRLPVEKIESNLQRLAQIRALLPQYLFEKLSGE